MTDGDFVFTSQDGDALSYTIVNMTRAQYGEQVLFQSGQSFHGLQFDGTSDPGGIDKVRYWRDTVKVPPRWPLRRRSARAGRSSTGCCRSCGGSSSGASSIWPSTASASAATGRLMRGRSGSGTTAT